MSRLAAFLNVSVEESAFANSRWKTAEWIKIFNKFVTSCQSESEFVNHLVAASKSGSDRIRYRVGGQTTFGRRKRGIIMRVLLIEDDSATAQSIELMLKSESFNVYTTDLGEEGVDLGKLYDYDIILLDLQPSGHVRIRSRCEPSACPRSRRRSSSSPAWPASKTRFAASASAPTTT